MPISTGKISGTYLLIDGYKYLNFRFLEDALIFIRQKIIRAFVTKLAANVSAIRCIILLFSRRMVIYIINLINRKPFLMPNELLISFTIGKFSSTFFYNEEFSQWSDVGARVRSRGQSCRCALLLRPGSRVGKWPSQNTE